MNDYGIVLGLYSNIDYLSDSIRNRFKDKEIETKIFCVTSDNILTKINYLIINCVTSNNVSDKGEIEKVIELIKRSTCKVLILFPQHVPNIYKKRSDEFLEKIIEINPNVGIILTPELLGATVKYNGLNISHEIILQSITSERIKIKNDGRLINTISLNTFCERIIKETFSFGLSGKKLSLIGPRRVARSFALKYLGKNETSIVMTSGEYDFAEIKGDVSISVSFSLRLAIKNTRNSFYEETSKAITKYDAPKPKVKGTKNKKMVLLLIKSILALIFIYLIPLVVIVVSALSLYASMFFVQSNNQLSAKFINVSYKTAQFAKDISLGNSFYYNTSNIVQKTANLSIEVLSLVSLGNDFSSKIIGKETYDLVKYSSDVSASLDKIYNSLGFLQTETTNLSKYVDKRVNISRIRETIYQFRNISSRLSVLLGVNKPMKYLVLFQNNMELRPTGGFIGSYALMTLDKGRLTEIIVSDVYSADGQLKGHVEPPEAIRDYLGEGGWFLRDSNWDPDFSQSSLKIEWFLEKEVNEKVDGLVAIDLSFIKNILKVTGPINLPDFNKTITSDNLYIETQNEVEEDFFPGSIKKASFLTSLSKNLIYTVENLPKEKYFTFFKEIYSSLEQKHIQLFVHDVNTQKALSNLKFTGEIDMDTNCNLRCLNDKYMLVDANLGVNKSNLFVQRSQFLNTTISKVGISHDLSIKYENTAGIAVGKSGIYKSYSRLVLPVEAKITEVRLHGADGKYENLKFDEAIVGKRKELGFLVEVVPSTQKTIQILWDIDTKVFENGGELNVMVQKQAGTDNDPLKIVIRTNDLTLTGKASPVYNTYLVKDFETKVYIK